MQKVKIRPADFPMASSRNRFDLPVVLSLAGIVSVAAVIGAAAFQGGFVTKGTSYLTGLVSSTDVEMAKPETDFTTEISRLNKKIAEISKQLQSIKKAQTTTTTRVDDIEEAFTSTASISSSAVVRSSPYFRILETGWNADDMVTRTQKRDRIALLNSEVMIQDDGRMRPVRTTARPRYAVELASYENIITARNAWRKLSRIHSSLLDKLEPRLLPALDTPDKKGRVKLIVGPIKTAARAAQVCSTLRSSGQACQERLFSTSNVMVVSAPEKSNIKSSQ